MVIHKHPARVRVSYEMVDPEDRSHRLGWERLQVVNAERAAAKGEEYTPVSWDEYLRTDSDANVRESGMKGQILITSEDYVTFTGHWNLILGISMFETGARRWTAGDHEPIRFGADRESALEFRRDGESFSIWRRTPRRNDGEFLRLIDGFGVKSFCEQVDGLWDTLLDDLKLSYPWVNENPGFQRWFDELSP